jgi:hypothetical protein
MKFNRTLCASFELHSHRHRFLCNVDHWLTELTKDSASAWTSSNSGSCADAQEALWAAIGGLHDDFVMLLRTISMVHSARPCGG